MNSVSGLASVKIDGQPLSIEYRWIGESTDNSTPLMVFLHEGLGSVLMWQNFPQLLCETLGYRGLVYSRPGYGQSTPRRPGEKWSADYMHRQAQIVLPKLLDTLGIDSRTDPPWLLGHSDGGSIALIYAASFPEQVAGLVLLAPHIMIEDITIKSIEAMRKTYLDTDLKQRLKL